MKASIKNRKGQTIVAVIDEAENPKGLAFVTHGLGGFKEQPHIATFARAFTEQGLTAVRFDTTNTFGESHGQYEDATATNYLQDLEDVVEWSRSQPWRREPFYLAGHSLGGLSVTLYAEKHAEQVKGLAPISTVVSGKLSAEAHGELYIREWEKTGWREDPSASIPGVIKRLPWTHMIDRLRYDALPDARKLTMPVLMIVGEKDTITPLQHQNILYGKLTGDKELHVIKNAAHTFREKPHLAEISSIFADWIARIERGTPRRSPLGSNNGSLAF